MPTPVPSSKQDKKKALSKVRSKTHKEIEEQKEKTNMTAILMKEAAKWEKQTSMPKSDRPTHICSTCSISRKCRTSAEKT